MTPSRETIMVALLARLQAAAAFQTIGRELQIFTDVPNQPALFLVDRDEVHPPRGTGLPDGPILEPEAWIYTNSTPLSQAINNLIDAIEAVLAPDQVFDGVSIENAQTLGGLVQHCWIEGTVEKAFSHKQRQAVAVVPLRVLCPQ